MATPALPTTASVIPFPVRSMPGESLTYRDRLEVRNWREQARLFDYDRLVIHEPAAGDPPELGSFLSVYRRGDPWSRFAIARAGGRIIAWCARTHRDVGWFNSVQEALLALLPPSGGAPTAVPDIAPTCNVIRLATVA